METTTLTEKNLRMLEQRLEKILNSDYVLTGVAEVPMSSGEREYEMKLSPSKKYLEMRGQDNDVEDLRNAHPPLNQSATSTLPDINMNKVNSDYTLQDVKRRVIEPARVPNSESFA